MLRHAAIRTIGLTAVLAIGTLSASAQAVKPGKGIPGGGNPGVAARGGGAALGAMQAGRGGMGGPRGMAPRSINPGRAGGGWSGPRGGGGYPGGVVRREGGRGGWGGAAAVGAGIGLGLGLAGAYPSYDYYGGPAYQSYPTYPAYQSYPAYASPGLGDHCETPRKVCTLYDSAPLGADCSCRVPGGRAYGEVAP
jgi:hypothetical protein